MRCVVTKGTKRDPLTVSERVLRITFLQRKRCVSFQLFRQDSVARREPFACRAHERGCHLSQAALRRAAIIRRMALAGIEARTIAALRGPALGRAIAVQHQRRTAHLFCATEPGGSCRASRAYGA